MQLLLLLLLLQLQLMLKLIKSYPESAFRSDDVTPFKESVCYHLTPLHQGQVKLDSDQDIFSAHPVYKKSKTEFHIPRPSKHLWNGVILALRNAQFELNNVMPEWKIRKGNVQVMPCFADNQEFQIISHNDSNNAFRDILIDVNHKKTLEKLHFWATFVNGTQSFYGPYDFGSVFKT